MGELDSFAASVGQAHLELAAKGWDEPQISAAVKWAVKTAASAAAAAPPGTRDLTFTTALQTRLREAESYLIGCARAARDREAQRGVVRAIREREYRRQVKRGFGTDPKQAGKAWDAAAPAAVARWADRFRGGPALPG